MSEHVRQKRTQRVSRHPSKRALDTKVHNSSPDTAPRALDSNHLKRVHIASQASKLPTSCQPSRGDIFQDLYIANFISAQDPSVHPWIVELPKLAATSSGKSELYGIRAATLALYAKLSGNKDLEVEAVKWYSKGLDAQRDQLPLAAKTKSYRPCCHKSIGAAMMFSYFESVICTMPVGWMQHYAAAIKMFEIARPENCQTGLMNMFFRSVRVAAVRLSELLCFQTC
jgi:hypothetical protein